MKPNCRKVRPSASSIRIVSETPFYAHYNQLNFFVPATLNEGYPAKLGWQYAKANIFPIVNVTGFYQLTSAINAVYKEHVYDPSDVVTLIRGKHILHFGGEYLFFRDNSTPGETQPLTARLPTVIDR